MPLAQKMRSVEKVDIWIFFSFQKSYETYNKVTKTSLHSIFLENIAYLDIQFFHTEAMSGGKTGNLDIFLSFSKPHKT